MDIWKIKRSEFVRDFIVSDDDIPDDKLMMQDLKILNDELNSISEDWDETGTTLKKKEHAGWLKERIRLKKVKDGTYFAVPTLENSKNLMLVFVDNTTYEKYVEGFYVGPLLWITKDARKVGGLGALLTLATAERRSMDEMDIKTYTTAGKRCHEKAHRYAVEKALKNGFPVPKEVLADYPGLENIYKKGNVPVGSYVMTPAEVMARRQRQFEEKQNKIGM